MAKWAEAEIQLDDYQLQNLQLAIGLLDDMIHRGTDRNRPLDSTDWQSLISTRALLIQALNG